MTNNTTEHFTPKNRTDRILSFVGLILNILSLIALLLGFTSPLCTYFYEDHNFEATLVSSLESGNTLIFVCFCAYFLLFVLCVLFFPQ